MLRRQTVAGLSILGILHLGIGVALAADAPRIGIVDLQRIVLESKVGKAGLAEIKAFQEARQKEITAEEQKLLKLKKDFESQQFTLTDDAKKLQRDRISDVEIGLKRMLEDADRELRLKRNDLLVRINKEVMDVISKIGKERGFDLIFDKEVFLHADPSLDITDLVIENYDKMSKP